MRWHSYRGEYARRKFVQGYSGRPNIKGGLGSYRPVDNVLNHSGALSFLDQSDNVVGTIRSTEDKIPAGIGFNAKDSNIIYSQSTTVQPSALRALTLIRAY